MIVAYRRRLSFILLCAWVLWSEVAKFGSGPGDKSGFFYHIEEALEDRKAFEAARTKEEPQRKEKRKESAGPSSMFVRMICLPDTVNPGDRI